MNTRRKGALVTVFVSLALMIVLSLLLLEEPGAYRKKRSSNESCAVLYLQQVKQSKISIPEGIDVNLYQRNDGNVSLTFNKCGYEFKGSLKLIDQRLLIKSLSARPTDYNTTGVRSFHYSENGEIRGGDMQGKWGDDQMGVIQ